jgi:tocopherol O-methyltransferase
MAADPRVVAWYEAKTDELLLKYGPGPIVHYHTGLVDPSEPSGTDVETVLAQMRHAQARMLERALVTWDAPNRLRGTALDAGAGFGGTAIHLAQSLGTRVTAVTPVARHVELMRAFVEQAGVSNRVVPLLGDAHEVEGEACFDAIYSIGASNYFDKRRWFERARRLVRPGGAVLIEDTFIGRPGAGEGFDAYWHSRIGTLEEYEQAAVANGFVLERVDDVTAQAEGFWRLAADYSRLRLRDGLADRAMSASRHASLEWHRQFRQGHREGDFRDLILVFVTEC